MLGPQAYADDPLRPLRLARLAAELGFAPDEETEQLTAVAAQRLSEPSAERVYAELRRAVAAPYVLEALALAERTGVLGVVLPELVALEGVEQSRFHHLDVYHHTVEVLRRWMALEADLEAVFGDLSDAIREQLDEPLADGLTRGQAIRFGALFHDIAKPQTRDERPDGRPTFIGHDARGRAAGGHDLHPAAGQRAHAQLRGRADAPPPGAGLHGARPPAGAPRPAHLPPPLPAGGGGGHAAVVRGPHGHPGGGPGRLDHRPPGAGARGHGRPRWPGGRAGRRRYRCAATSWPRELGIAPGPELGRLLADLEGAVYAGEVADREQAVTYARRMLDNPER